MTTFSKAACTLACTCFVLSASAVAATVSLDPLASFGGGDGWLSPGENGYSYLTSGITERGLAYSSDSDHLYLVSRSSGASVRILNATDGTEIGALSDQLLGGGTIGGGDLVLNMVGASPDGSIYAGNVTVNSTTRAFRIYKWVDEISLPTVVFNGDPLTGSRVGDTFDVVGSGANTRIVAGFGGTTFPGYVVIDPNDQTFLTANPAGTANGDFKFGLTFAGDGNRVWGTQGGANGVRFVQNGSLTGSAALTGVTERPMDFAMVGGVPLLATIESSTSGADNEVRIYDMTNPTSPLLLATGNNTSFYTPPTNAPGTGSLTWGNINQATGKATLYAMATSNGIQAFEVTVVVPEPTTTSVLLAAGLFFGVLYRPRSVAV